MELVRKFIVFVLICISICFLLAFLYYNVPYWIAFIKR